MCNCAWGFDELSEDAPALELEFGYGFFGKTLELDVKDLLDLGVCELDFVGLWVGYDNTIWLLVENLTKLLLLGLVSFTLEKEMSLHP